eukprot:Opistho-1_new@22551
MILDNQAMYSNAQTITALGDTPSTNGVDHGSGNSGPGMAGLMLVIRTDAAFTSGGAGTLQPILQDSADNSSFADVLSLTPALPLAALTTNAVVAQVRMPGNVRRFSRIAWRVAGATMTGGRVTAALSMGVDRQQYMPNGFNV